MSFLEPLYAAFARAAGSGWLPAAFEHAFMARALLAALLAGPLLAGLGTVVVARRLPFFTEVVGHAALTGVAVGLWLGEPPGETWVGLFGFCLATALGLEYLRRTARLPHDTLTGVVLAGSLGLGLALLGTASRGFDMHRVEAVLFGSPLTVTEGDLALLAVLFLALALLSWRAWNPLMLRSLSPDLAAGSPAAHLAGPALDYGFVAVLSVVVVASLEVVGALLVLALVAVPAATAQILARGLRGFFWCSLALGVLAALGGLLLSAVLPIPPGGGIALVAVAVFLLAQIGTALLGKTRISQTETPW